MTEDRRFSRRARERIDENIAKDTLLLSLISVWEVAKKVEKGQLVLDRPATDWIDLAAARPPGQWFPSS